MENVRDMSSSKIKAVRRCKLCKRKYRRGVMVYLDNDAKGCECFTIEKKGQCFDLCPRCFRFVINFAKDSPYDIGRVFFSPPGGRDEG